MGVVLRKNIGSTNSQGSSYKGSFTDYSDLSTQLPTSNIGDFAVVENPTGTSWLPWTLGGTYYPQGTYYWDGTKWDTNVEKIVEELQELENKYLKNRIVVNQANVATTLGGVIDPLKEYFIDGIINITGFSIEVPIGGINLKGYDFDISGLVSTENNYIMFTSAIGGSGDFLASDFYIQVSGTNSKVYDIVDVDGLHAIEVLKLNYINCTSLGVIDSYRQLLEFDTGRFGGSPSLEFKGTWLGGARITTSIARGLNPLMTDAIFKAGLGFVMNSRFLTDLNIDLPALATLTDFTPSNFVNSSSFQLTGTLVSRNGVFNPEDINTNPNISRADVVSFWKGNVGLSNTHVGGQLIVTTEVATVVSAIGTYYPLVGTWSSVDLEHFDSPSNGQLRHLGNTPREYKFISDLAIDGGSNNDLTIRIRKFKFSDSSTSTVYSQSRQVNNFAGGRDVAFFALFASLTLDKNDYVYLEIANNTSTTNLTAELDSFFNIEER